MNKRSLEITLERVPPIPEPDAELEQYSTPATVAADLVYTAFMLGDVDDMNIVDLGCGTGILAIGASLLGAEKVTAIDIDPESLEVGRESAEELGAEVEFIEGDISILEERCDTIIMNPPFGAQTKHADRAFIEKAIELSNVIYSLHNGNTADFIRGFAAELEAGVTREWDYEFTIKKQFDFHSHDRVDVDVTAFRIVPGRYHIASDDDEEEDGY